MKSIKLIVAVLLALCFIMPCAIAETDASVSGELTIALAADTAPDSVTTWVNMFQEKYPDVKLNVNLVDASNYALTVEPFVTSGEMPDVIFVTANDYFAKLADEGLLLDVSDTIGWDRQMDFIQEAYTSPSGVKFGISSGATTMVLYYNEDHFADAGIETVPTCWEEFIDCCAKLKDAGYAPLAIAGAGANNLAHSFMGLGIAHEIYGTGYDQNWKANNMAGEYNFDTPEWNKVLERTAYLRDNGYFQQGFESADLYEALRVFAAGEASMTIQQAAQAGNIFIDDSMNLNCMEVPWQYEGKERVAMTWSLDGVGLGKNSKNEENLELAKLFLEFISYENAYVFQNMTGCLSPFKDVSDMPNMNTDARVQAAYEANATAMQSPLPVLSFNAVTYAQVKTFVQEVVLGLAEPDQIGEYLNPAQAEYAASIG